MALRAVRGVERGGGPVHDPVCVVDAADVEVGVGHEAGRARVEVRVRMHPDVGGLGGEVRHQDLLPGHLHHGPARTFHEVEGRRDDPRHARRGARLGVLERVVVHAEADHHRTGRGDVLADVDPLAVLDRVLVRPAVRQLKGVLGARTAAPTGEDRAGEKTEAEKRNAGNRAAPHALPPW